MDTDACKTKFAFIRDNPRYPRENIIS